MDTAFEIANTNLIIYDGRCNLCAGSVKFIRKLDRHDCFEYVSFQSPEAKFIPALTKMNLKSPDHILFFKNNKLFDRSDAVIEILKEIGGVWSLSNALYLIPRQLRNWIYDRISQNRYRWFGVSEKNCSL